MSKSGDCRSWLYAVDLLERRSHVLERQAMLLQVRLQRRTQLRQHKLLRSWTRGSHQLLQKLRLGRIVSRLPGVMVRQRRVRDDLEVGTTPSHNAGHLGVRQGLELGQILGEERLAGFERGRVAGAARGARRELAAPLARHVLEGNSSVTNVRHSLLVGVYAGL